MDRQIEHTWLHDSCHRVILQPGDATKYDFIVAKIYYHGAPCIAAFPVGLQFRAEWHAVDTIKRLLHIPDIYLAPYKLPPAANYQGWAEATFDVPKSIKENPWTYYASIIACGVALDLIQE